MLQVHNLKNPFPSPHSHNSILKFQASPVPPNNAMTLQLHVIVRVSCLLIGQLVEKYLITSIPIYIACSAPIVSQCITLLITS
jgi:hypothetical protein